MTDTENQNINHSYQSAISLATSEGEILWSRFNALLTANTIFTTLIGIFITNLDFNLKVSLVRIMSSIGFAVCVLWFRITSRGFEMHKFWLLTARESEEKLGIHSLKRGDKFRHNESVNFEILSLPKEKRNFQRSWHSRLSGDLNTELASYFIIALFAIIYIYMFCHATG